MQQDASSVLTLENKIQVCTCRDFASQTEAEIMTRCQVEKLTEIMQSRFDEVIGQCQEQMAHLQNLVARLCTKLDFFTVCTKRGWTKHGQL